MAKRNRDGKFIITAGEVGVYTVCPEQWRLTVLEPERISADPDEARGRALHFDWANEVNEVVFLRRSAWLMAALVCVAVVLFLLVRAG